MAKKNVQVRRFVVYSPEGEYLWDVRNDRTTYQGFVSLVHNHNVACRIVEQGIHEPIEKKTDFTRFSEVTDWNPPPTPIGNLRIVQSDV